MYNWLFTMYGGRLRFATPMLWSLGFMLTWIVGGMTGVLLAVPPADFVLHNSLFLVAHFHNVIIGGVLFGMFAGINYWWPKAFGFKLDAKWGNVSFWCWVVGFWVAFTPLYVLGLMGVTRRLRHFDDPSLQIWFIIAGIGAAIIAVGIAAFLMQIFVSIRDRNSDRLRDFTGDPWDGRSLEWATSSPPPAYNFAFTPVVHDLDAYYDMKKRNAGRPLEGFRDIHMPRNTGAGVILAGLSAVIGLSMIWYIWWLAALAFAGLLVVAIGHTFNYDRDYHIPAEEVTRTENERTRALAAHQPVEALATGA
jgi:cytochrome o ubiquinol oxidase subunit 1